MGLFFPRFCHPIAVQVRVFSGIISTTSIKGTILNGLRFEV